MVRIAGLNGQAAAGVVVRSADGRTPQQTLARPGSASSSCRASSPSCGPRSCVRRSRRRASHLGSRRPPDKERAELERRYEREIYPVLTPLAVGPGQPFPYISRALDQPGRIRRAIRRRARSALRGSRFRRACRASSSVGDGGHFVAAGAGCSSHFLPRSSPGWTCSSARLPRHARRGLRGLRRGGRPARGGRARAAPPPLRRDHAGRGVGVDVARDARADSARPARRRRARLSGRGDARSRRPRRADEARPARPEGGPVGAGWAAAARKPRRRRRPVRRDPRRRHPRPPPVRLVRRELRVVRQHGRLRPERDRAEVDGVPHERRHAARAGADRGVGERQAERVSRRDQGPR